jgi:hypothetical protein
LERPFHGRRTAVLPASSRPLPLLNQNFVVTSGFTMASNTCSTGLRMSIPVLAIGTRVIRGLSMMPSSLTDAVAISLPAPGVRRNPSITDHGVGTLPHLNVPPACCPWGDRGSGILCTAGHSQCCKEIRTRGQVVQSRSVHP